MAISAVGAPPPVIESIDPDEVIEKPVPQPALKVFGQNLRQPGVFDASGNPTITIEHTELKDVSFSAVASTNFAGTEATIPAGLNHFNMLQMPLGLYDVTLTRPDGSTAIVAEGFSLVEEPELDLEPGEVKMTIASHWGGPVTGADVHGDYAYLANGRRLVIVDISDESNPVEVGSITALMPGHPRRVLDVKVQDGFVFVVGGGNSTFRYFSIVDVSDPSSPELMWVGAASNDSTTVCLDGSLAYTMGGSSTRKFDISDPLNPVDLGSTTEACNPGPMPEIEGWHSPAELTFMAKSGDLLYVADRWSGFTVIDVSDPTAPLANRVISTYTHQPYEDDVGEIMGLAIEDDRAYLTLRQLGLEIVDISDPANPIFLNAFRPTSFNFGDHSCLPSDFGNFCVPDTCTECADHAANLDCSYFSGIEVRNGMAHIGAFLSTCSSVFACNEVLACQGNYFLTIDVSDPLNPSQFNALRIDCCGRTLTRIALGEPDTAFVAGNVLTDVVGMERYFGAVSSTAPVLLNEFVPPPGANDIAWSDDMVFVTRSTSGAFSQENGLHIRDVFDPANPILLEHVDEGTRYFTVDVQNERLYAYRQDQGGTVAAFDISELSNPGELYSITTGGGGQSNKHHVLASEPMIFLTNSGSGNSPYGLTILNVHGTEPECGVADLNCDGVVDGLDLFILLGNWGVCPGGTVGCTGDINNDGVVDAEDLFILLGNWG